MFQRLHRLAAGCAALLLAVSAHADPGTSFSFQGEFRDNGAPASGPYDFEVALYGQANGGSALDVETLGDIVVQQGLFDLALDFTDVPFAASTPAWLEIRVRPGASTGAYTPLSPRQRVAPTPYAINTRTVQANGVDAAAIATGAVGAGKIAPGAVGANEIAAGSVGTTQVDATQVQRRISGTCGAGNAVQTVNADGTVTCATTGAGTITSVIAGTGLSGGGASGSVSLSVANDGITTTQIADGTIAAVDVDSAQVQRRITGTCTGGAIQQVNANGSVVCATVPTVPLPLPKATGITLLSLGGPIAMVIGQDGLPLFVVQEFVAQDVYIVHCNDPACISVTRTLVDAAGSVGSFVDITLVDGLGTIVYYDATNTRLKFAACADIGCTTLYAPPLVLDAGPNVGQYAQIGVDVFGKPIAAYYDAANGDLKLIDCGTYACSGGNATYVVESTGDMGRNATLLSHNGRAYIFYNDATGFAARVASCFPSTNCTGAAVTVAAVGPAGQSGGPFAPVLLDDGRIGTFYRRQGFTGFNACTTSACTAFGTDVPAVNVDPVSIAATRGPDGIQFVAVRYAQGGNDFVSLGRCNDRACASVQSGVTLAGFATAPGQLVTATTSPTGYPVFAYTSGQTTTRVSNCDNPYCSAGTRIP